jgi:hypothetical protein
MLLLAAPTAAAAKAPTIVELYTAQGCASCGEANAFVAKLAERPDVLPLTFSVDYWDYLGWADTFARPEFAARQRAYVAKLALREPYTPQVVVDGRAQAAGQQTGRIETLIREAQHVTRDPPEVKFITARRVDVGFGHAPHGAADVWLVRYDPRERDVEIKSGDNRGQTIAHRNVVRQVQRLGAWRGLPTAYRLPPAPEDGLSSVLLVQARESGRILAVGRPDA